MSCPFCLSKRTKSLNFSKKYYLRSLDKYFQASLRICKSCYGIWQNKPPSSKLLNQYYQNNNQYRSIRIAKNEIKVLKKQLTFFLKKEKLAGRQVLEIGADTGKFLDYIKIKTRAKTFFSEVNKKCNQFLVKKGHLSIKKGKIFEGIFLLHTLEHIKNPIRFLMSIKKKLSQTGFLAIEVPDHSFWNSETTTDNFEHISYFSSNALCNLLTRAGFLIEKLEINIDKNNDSFNKRFLRIKARKKDKSTSKISADHFSHVLKVRQTKIKNLSLSEKKIGIYGVGMLTDELLQNSDLKADKVSAFFDNDKKKQKINYFGKRVKSIKQIQCVDQILIISSAQKTIKKELVKNKFKGPILVWDDLISK